MYAVEPAHLAGDDGHGRGDGGQAVAGDVAGAGAAGGGGVSGNTDGERTIDAGVAGDLAGVRGDESVDGGDGAAGGAWLVAAAGEGGVVCIFPDGVHVRHDAVGAGADYLDELPE